MVVMVRVVINGLPYARTTALGHRGAEAGLCTGARHERTHKEVTSLSLSLSLCGTERGGIFHVRI